MTARGVPRGRHLLVAALFVLVGVAVDRAAQADGALAAVHLPDGAAATTSVDLDINGDYRAESFALSDPPRFILDLVGTTGRSTTLAIGTAQVLRVRSAQYRTDPPVVRLVFDLAYPSEPTLEPRTGGLRVRFPPGPPTITHPDTSSGDDDPLPIVQTTTGAADDTLDPPLPLIEAGAGVSVTPPLKPIPDPRDRESAATAAPTPVDAPGDRGVLEPLIEPAEPVAIAGTPGPAEGRVLDAVEDPPGPADLAEETRSAPPLQPARVPGRVLVLKDGQRMALREPWRLDGRRIVFTTKSGIFSSIRTGEVDLEASSLRPR